MVLSCLLLHLNLPSPIPFYPLGESIQLQLPKFIIFRNPASFSCWSNCLAFFPPPCCLWNSTNLKESVENCYLHDSTIKLHQTWSCHSTLHILHLLDIECMHHSTGPNILLSIVVFFLIFFIPGTQLIAHLVDSINMY